MKFTKSLSGRVVRTIGGYDAFIPNPLPPNVDWNEIIDTLSEANYFIGMLAQVGKTNPHLMTRSFIAREAMLSSKIEGTHTTLGELLENEVTPCIQVEHEVSNYIKSLDYGIKRLEDLPLSLRFIREVHQRLMQGVRGDSSTPGEFRKVQNWIGLPGSTLQTASYVPPSPNDLKDCLKDFESFLHDKRLPPLLHIALCHYQFEAIHPFLDGNGRVGRSLITLLLIEKGLLKLPLLYLSAFFEATRDEYYKQLYNVTSKGSWTEWCSYFLRGIILQSQDALSRIERINSLLNSWQIKVGRGSIRDVVRNLAENPFLTAKSVSQNLKIAFTTAQASIRKLEELGIVTQTSKAKRDRVYCAKEILNILEEPAKIE